MMNKLIMKNMKPEDSTVLKQNKLLAEALGSCILASGIVRKDVQGLTGPELLLFAEDLRKMLEAKSSHDVPQSFDWSKFPGHLIDHYEGEVLTEELLQRAAADLCADNTPPEQQSKEDWITDEGRLQWAMWRIKDLEDKLKNRSLGCPVAWRVGHSGEYHYFTNCSDAVREKVEYENYSGEECGNVEPLYTQKSL